MTKDAVYKVLNGEREYQDRKWGGKTHDTNHSVADWLTYMRHYMRKAEEAITTQSNSTEALHQLRKVVALGVACFEVHGVPNRSEYE